MHGYKKKVETKIRVIILYSTFQIILCSRGTHLPYKTTELDEAF